jgi:hypothetical protein
MPKDYQEIERIVEQICDFDFESKLWSDKGFDEFKDILRNKLTTYGNARALETLEMVEKGVPAVKDEFHMCATEMIDGVVVSSCPRFCHNVEYNQVVKSTLDHIERVKSELKPNPSEDLTV